MMTLGTYHRSKTKEKGRENQEVRQGMQRNKKAGGNQDELGEERNATIV